MRNGYRIDAPRPKPKRRTLQKTSTPHMECCPPHCEHFIDMRKLFPIHLKDEGYTSFEVEIVDAPEGLVATASLDPDDDWIVRVSIESDIGAKSFSDAMITRRFSVFAKTGTNKRDLVFNGTIVVTPTAHLGTRRE